MDTSDNRPHAAPLQGPAPVFGEVVIVHGRGSGQRQVLTSPLTLLGQAAHCDIRLQADSVGPVHCVLAWGADGPHLRDLGCPGGTLVNRQPFTSGRVGPEDRITIGPFQVRVVAGVALEGRLPQSQAELEAERDALRIQAAAVIAQQAGLTEEEGRLRQRRLALERQKEQLAVHLEQRRQHLLELQEQIRQDRAALRVDCEAAHKEHEQNGQTLDKARAEVAEAQDKAAKERRRLVDLRQRLKQRWHRHWDAQVAELAAQRRSLAEQREHLHQQTGVLAQERAAHVQAQLRFNGEIELGRLRLQDEWQQLGLAQQQWEATLNEEQARRNQVRRDLDRQAAAVAAGEKLLSERLWQSEQRLGWLQAETRGLETRAQHLRQKLLEQEKEVLLHNLVPTGSPDTPGQVHLPAGSLVAVPVSRPSRALSLCEARARVAAALADQRRHLLEQWFQLLAVLEAWQANHGSTLAALGDAVQQCEQRQRQLSALEQAVEAGHAEGCQRQKALSEVRCGLEGWHARLTAREAGLQADHMALLAEIREREEIAAGQAARLEELCRHRLDRCSQEIEALRGARTQCEEMRRDYAALWKECQERRAALAGEQRDLAARVLALETLRQESLNRSSEPAASARRLQRYERQHAIRLKAEEKTLEEERLRVAGEVKRLDELARHLRRVEEELAARQEQWARQETAREGQRAAAATSEHQRQVELERLRTLHALQERQIAQLREEIERVARLLMDEAEVPELLVPSANQAA